MQQQEWEQFLQAAARQLGTTPAQLKQWAENGSLSAMLEQLHQGDEQSLQRVLRDQKAAQQLLQSTQAQAILQQRKQQS